MVQSWRPLFGTLPVPAKGRFVIQLSTADEVEGQLSEVQGALEITATLLDSVQWNGAGGNRRIHFPARRDLDLRRVGLVRVVLVPAILAFAATISYDSEPFPEWGKAPATLTSKTVSAGPEVQTVEKPDRLQPQEFQSR